jgi:hypothetical protein
MTDIEAGVLGEFDVGERMAAAARRLVDAGYDRIVTFSPFQIPHLDRTLRVGRTRLPFISLCAGLAGAAFAYWLQWYTAAVSYPLNAGGRPAHAAPAFILITFETAVLMASCMGFFAIFYLLGMPRYWHPVSEIEGFERATVDRFWVGVSRDDPRYDEQEIARTLEDEHPLRIVTLEPPA